MQLRAFLANSLWAASNFPASARFERALQNPAAIQHDILQRTLRANAETAFGKQHSFASVCDSETFQRVVPLSTYEDLKPWILRIQHGERNILTAEAVTHLVPTSGSTSARKLIPFTPALQSQVNAAIAPWMFDLVRQFPKILAGPAYWSITPPLTPAETEPSRIPIGFDADTSYLAGWKRGLADAVMAVSNSVARASTLADFHTETWRHLSAARELRLISVWHPSFLTLLLDAHDPAKLWPKLQVISCWGDAAARPYIPQLQERFPKVHIQPKGLLATEAFVTIPFRSKYPLAIISHFFEFRDGEKILLAHELELHREYDVIVTTAGGLYRYNLGDRVRVTGFLEKTPCLEFLGRGDSVSDLFGEKLSEPFVTETLRDLFAPHQPAFAMLAPESDRYIIFVEGAELEASSLDLALRKNPHYALCRDLNQLRSPRVVQVRGAFQRYLAQQTKNGAPLGAVKPRSLSNQTGWSQVFSTASEC